MLDIIVYNRRMEMCGPLHRLSTFGEYMEGEFKILLCPESSKDGFAGGSHLGLGHTTDEKTLLHSI